MKEWQGKALSVKILYSQAGVAQQILVQNKNGTVLFDIGDGTLRDILSNNLDLQTLKGFVFTHGHFDHVGGLHSLLGYLRMIGRKEDLPIVFPKDCVEVISTIKNFKMFYNDTLPFTISCKEISEYEIFDINGMNIKAFPVVHCGGIEGSSILKRIPAMGYRISFNSEIIALTGDTGLCDSLEELVKKADLAIIESTIPKEKIVEEEIIKNVHLSENLAKAIGEKAKDYILIHKTNNFK